MSTSTKAFVPTVLLSTLIIGSGVAWWVTRSSSNNETESSSVDVQKRLQHAQEPIDTDEVKTRLQRSWSLIQTMVTQLQSIYDRYGRDMLDQLQTVKQESQDMIETAKEAGAELQDIAQEQGQEAVQGARQGLEQKESSSSHNTRGPFDSP